MVKAVAYGFFGGMFLVGFYLLVMGFASGSFSYALSEVVRLKYWIGSLVLGFSIQIGLFSYIRNYHQAGGLENKVAAGSATTSTAAMVACCAHHLTEVLPLVGLSITATFLAKYQQWFLGLGIFSNIVGIGLLIKHLRSMKN